MVGFGVLPAVILFLCLWFLFETPRWLVFHGEVDAAQGILEKIRPSGTIEIELSDIIKEHENRQQSKVGEINLVVYTLYRITGIFGSHFNLAVWQISFLSPN